MICPPPQSTNQQQLILFYTDNDTKIKTNHYSQSSSATNISIFFVLVASLKMFDREKMILPGLHAAGDVSGGCRIRCNIVLVRIIIKNKKGGTVIAAATFIIDSVSAVITSPNVTSACTFGIIAKIAAAGSAVINLFINKATNLFIASSYISG
eukprot:10406554-Ditylum_brightwellii.AAC.1